MYSGRAEGGRARLHVDVAGEAAIDEGRARPDELGEGEARQRLGVLLDQRARHGHRRHRARQRERRHDDDLIAASHLDDAFEHRGVQLQRRVDVLMMVRTEGSRSSCSWLMPRAMRAISMPSRIALAAERIGVEYLVGQLHEVRQAVEMAHRGMNIHGLDRITARQMNDVVHLAEHDELAEVFLVPRSAAPIHVRAVGSRGHLGKADVVAAKCDVVIGIAGADGEFARAGGDRLEDQSSVEAYTIGTGPHVGAGGLQDFPCLLVHEIHADFLEHRQRGLMD